MTIRQYAKLTGHTITGKLTPKPEWATETGDRWYVDEAGNEYLHSKDGCMIITEDGGVI